MPPLACVLLLSVALRIAVALYLGDQVPVGKDVYSYSQLAARLAAGHGYTFDRAWYPFTPADTPTAHWSFLYTAFLAAIYAVVGVHPLAARLVQAVLGGLLLPWMTYRLAQRVLRPSTDPRERGRAGLPARAEGHVVDPAAGPSSSPSARGAGHPVDSASDPLSIVRRPSSSPSARGEGHCVPLLAAAIAAIYAYFILYAARPITETFYIVALLWSLERALGLAENWTPGQASVLGLALGIAALLRQSILPWVPVLFLWLLWQRGVDSRRPSSFVLRPSSVVPLFVAGLVLLACILPFTIRNLLVYDQFLLLNSNAGYAMYSAQHPMHGTSFREYEAAPLPDDLRGQGLNEPQWDRALMRRGIQFVLEEPGRYLLLSLSRVRDLFEFWPTADSSPLYNVGRLISFTLFLPFMLYGIALAALRPAAVRRTAAARRSHERPTHPRSSVNRRSSFILLGLARFSTSPTALLLLFMAFYSVLHILTWAMTRYRLPVDAVAIIFAAIAIDDLAGRLMSVRPLSQLRGTCRSA